MFTRASAKSRVLRPVQPYYLAVRVLDAAGRLLGEHRFLGMLTVAALYENVLDIPVVERHVRGAIHRAGFPLESYSGQQMLEVISALPREELFSGTEQQLHDTAVGVLAVAGRRAVRVFLRPDPYHRFVSCLVYVPRDRYTTRRASRWPRCCGATCGGTSVDFTVRLTESALALVHFTVHTDPDAARTARPGDPSRWTSRISRTSSPRPSAPGTTACCRCPAAREVADLLPGVPEAYKAGVDPAQALVDLRYVAALSGPGDFGLRLYAPSGGQEQRFTLYLAGAPATLTAVLPVLQQLGVDVLDERPSEIVRPDGLRCWTYDFGLSMDVATQTALADRPHTEVAAQFTAAFAAAWRGEAETDGFSALVLRTGLTWREVAVLRAYARYARQLGNPYGVNYMADTLLAHPAVARALLGLFTARFDPALDPAGPGRRRGRRAGHRPGADRRGHRAGRRPHPAQLPRHDRRDPAHQLPPRPPVPVVQDRPVRGAGHARPPAPVRDLRLLPAGRGRAPALRRRRPRRPALERPAAGLPHRDPRPGQGPGREERRDRAGRGQGRVRRAPARGGQRRGRRLLQDVHLRAARRHRQPRRQPDGRSATVPPPDVVRHDGDDSYLVVAADKGTAKFSDIANEVAASYGFWLGDAFASGGSVGYDHKAMGITARGAWESVKRHFRELGVDTQAEEFTVVGIGDMSGDVFGNGMLLSPHIRLVAAFDHRHVFVDPDPDAARGFAERQRLFALPRSSWDDYDRDAISAGGGVWPRTAKSVPIGAGDPGRAGDRRRRHPAEPARADPGDPARPGGPAVERRHRHLRQGQRGDPRRRGRQGQRRDPGRRAASCASRSSGEGGNLGLTQRGRIEFARTGGKINTDAIDNSAGVDCSDHEVNIKILLDRLVADGALDRDARNALLVEMTDEVAELVLADNRAQNALLGVGRAHATGMIRVHRRFVADLETRRGIDRHLEVLPDEAGFAALEAAGHGLTGPELATLVAHAKLDLHARVLASDLPDTAAFSRAAAGVLPAPAARAVPRRDRRAPAAPGDPHDPAGQRDRRRRGHDVRVPHGGRAGRRPGRLRARLRGRHRRVRPARAVAAPGVAGDPDRRVGPGGAGVAAAARPRRALVPHQPAPAAGGRLGDHPVRRARPRAARRGCRSCWSGASARR